MPDTAGDADTARRQVDCLAALRLRFAVIVHLEDQALSRPAVVGAACGLPAPETQRLPHHKPWRDGEGATLQAIAGRFGLEARLDEDVFRRGRGGQAA